MSSFATYLARTRLSPQEIAARTEAIAATLLQQSSFIRLPNFQAIHPDDLEMLFEQYDERFFEGEVARHLGRIPLRFRLSKRLTSAAGTTTCRSRRHLLRRTVVDYQIAISTNLLYQTFRDDDQRVVTVSGVECSDRLRALQRIFEHELIHLIEMLLWTESKCSASRFQTIAGGFFGHRQHTHQLITQRERAWSKYGLRVGDRVLFRFEGRHYEGVLNRVTRRATVLVEDREGRLYTNGKRYVKYYIPIDQLQSATASN